MPCTMTDEQVLARAEEIRQEHAAREADEVMRLYHLYARKRSKEPHDLGAPKTLTPIEALLLFALERNKYEVSAECHNARHGAGRWFGDARCKYNLRESVIGCMAATRLDLLRILWAGVSEQEIMVCLTEKHLRGSILHRDIRRLRQELEAQESNPAKPEEDSEE